MKLVQTSYHRTKSKRQMPFVTQRVEFFLHYWSFMMYSGILKFEDAEFRSHRTLLQLLKNQIESNFKKSDKYVKELFLESSDFNISNSFISSIKTKGILNSLSELRRILNMKYNDFRHPDYTSKDEILKHINRLIYWCNKNYLAKILKIAYSRLKINSAPSDSELKEIRSLVNYLIIELYDKGYSKEYIKDYPATLISRKKLPLEKIRSDFEKKEDYDLYRVEQTSSVTLSKQLDSLKYVCNRKTHTWYKIYKVFGVDFDNDPIEILGIKFYNPTKTQLITENNKYLNELFELNNKDKGVSLKSFCNAIIKIESVTEDDLEIGFNEVLNAVRVFNKYYYAEGIILKKAFITSDENLRYAYGNFDAIDIGVFPKYSKNVFFTEALNNLNEFAIKKKDDYAKKIIEFKGFISDFKVNATEFDLATIWSYLESLFGSTNEVQSIALASFMDNIKKSHLYQAYFFIESMLIYHSMQSHHVYKLNDKQKKKLSIKKHLGEDKSGYTVYSRSAFRRIQLSKELLPDVLFLKYYVDRCAALNSPLGEHKESIKLYSDNLVRFLYVERNLLIHHRVVNNYAYLRRNSIIEMCETIINTYLRISAKYKHKKSHDFIIKKIKEISTS